MLRVMIVKLITIMIKNYNNNVKYDNNNDDNHNDNNNENNNSKKYNDKHNSQISTNNVGNIIKYYKRKNSN